MDTELTKLLASVILGAIGFGITVYYSRRTQKIANEKLMKELFTEFNSRYNELNNYLVEIEQKYPSLDELLKASKDENPEYGDFLKQKVIDYFSLCAEEFYWFHHKKRIDPLIWRSWHSGMNYWYKIPAIRSLWQKEVKENGKESYYIYTNGKKTAEFFKD